ncbi:MAG TPA: winged helix-turn-helix domain-containing protein [Thermoanaerobaculia bacterium]|jgi:TolB-like protein/Tfp pilus assembly protein PilF|nr:winged helix-turn-helix domain-containing protein [Thermoanaerobaculia bacterium]
MIRFGPFALEEATGELRRDGEVVPLAPQPFRLLLALAKRPGELLTRDELRQQVWGDDTFVDFERGLNFCVLQARTALGDDAKQPSYIETLPKRGYRFIAPIEAPVEPRPRSRRIAIVVTAAALLVFVVVAALQRDKPAPVPSTNTKTMLAVLPFDDLSGGRDLPFADGMTEELITHLGALQPRRLGVIARTSILTYRGTTKSIRDIGRELGVAYVVEGSVRREGERVRVTAQLIDTRDQTHLWAETFDRDATAALAIQRDVAERIARALRIELLASDSLTARSPAAHEAYLRGRHLWNERKTASVEASVRELREAIRLEPTFVLAHIALAESLHILAMRGEIDSPTAIREIGNASDTALRLAPSLAQSHGTRAMLRFWHQWDWEGAEDSYQAAMQRNPDEPGALHDHGWLLIVRGRFDEGITQIRRAQELDPVSPRANMHVAWAYTYTRQYAEAIRESNRALELSPGYPEAWHCLEQAYLLSGDFASALAARKKYEPELVASDPKTFYAELRARVAKNVDPENPYDTAARFVQAGDRGNAIAWLRRVLNQRSPSFVLAGVDPKLESLHGDERYVQLLRSVGLEPVTRQTR